MRLIGRGKCGGWGWGGDGSEGECGAWNLYMIYGVTSETTASLA